MTPPSEGMTPEEWQIEKASMIMSHIFKIKDDEVRLRFIVSRLRAAEERARAEAYEDAARIAERYEASLPDEVLPAKRHSASIAAMIRAKAAEVRERRRD